MNQNDSKLSAATVTTEQQAEPSTASAPTPARTAREARADGRRNEAEPGRSDAPPSNTASDNCKLPYFKALRWGVDSLYLSYPGDLFPEVEAQLKHLKQLAQANEPAQQAEAQYAIGAHIFEVKDKGAALFPYILEDGAFRIQLSRRGKRAPMAYVKIAATYLAHVGPAAAEEALRDLLGQLGELHESANVSRIDLFVDFASSESMESWGREAWVTRAASINTYAVKGVFSGWAIGLGGVVACRLYNKLLEIVTSGKDYLLGLWSEAGWQPSEPVWRLEFEFKREVLTQKGLSKLYDVLRHLDGLWSYGTTEWLRLTQPNPDDQTRTRWPLHPLWLLLSSVDWQGDGGPLLPRYSPLRVPGDDKLFSLGLSVLLSFMARQGITDLYEGHEEFMAALYQYHEGKSYRLGIPFDHYIAEKLALKVRQFNARLNNPAAEEERLQAEREQAAKAYRRASEGG